VSQFCPAFVYPFAAIRCRPGCAFCVGRTMAYYSTPFSLVRQVPGILCQEFCCDSVTTDEKRERDRQMAVGVGTDARHGGANTSFDRSFATGAAALSSISCIGLAVRVAPSGLRTWDLAYRIRGSGKVRRARAHRRCEPPRLATNYQRDRPPEQGQDSTLILQSNGRLPSGVS
jgi:hypothetical protein